MKQESIFTKRKKKKQVKQKGGLSRLFVLNKDFSTKFTSEKNQPSKIVEKKRKQEEN